MLLRELLVKLSIDTNKFKNGLHNAEASLEGFKKTCQVTTFAAASLFAVLLAGAASLLSTSSKFEDLRTTIDKLEGSAEKGKKSFAWIKAFAATTPYELEQVTEAFIQLKSYGLEATDGTLKTLGDTAAALNKPLSAATGMLADAIVGENERLKEFGVRVKKSEDHVHSTYTWINSQGVQLSKTIDSTNQKIIQSTLNSIFNEKFSGMMMTRSKTMSGIMSNLKDNLSTIADDFAQKSGLFDTVKNALKGLLDVFNSFNTNGGAEKLASSFKFLLDILPAVIASIIAATTAIIIMNGSAILALITSLPIVTGLIAAFAFVINSLPLVAVITAVSIAFGFLVDIIIKWIRGDANVLYNWFGSFESVVKRTGDAFNFIANQVKSFFNALSGGNLDKWIGKLRDITNAIGSATSGAFKATGEYVYGPQTMPKPPGSSSNSNVTNNVSMTLPKGTPESHAKKVISKTSSKMNVPLHTQVSTAKVGIG